VRTEREVSGDINWNTAESKWRVRKGRPPPLLGRDRLTWFRLAVASASTCSATGELQIEQRLYN